MVILCYFGRPPRTYPPKFGLRLAKLHPRFCRSRTLYFGAQINEDDINCGLNLFSSMSWEEDDVWWMDAGMKSVFAYLRGSKDLRLGALRPLFPTEF